MTQSVFSSSFFTAIAVISVEEIGKVPVTIVQELPPLVVFQILLSIATYKKLGFEGAIAIDVIVVEIPREEIFSHELPLSYVFQTSE